MIELVQFKISHYKRGDTIWHKPGTNFFDTDLFIGWLDEITIEQMFKRKRRHRNSFSTDIAEYTIQYPFIHFEPSTYLSKSSDFIGMSDEVQNSGLGDVFNDYLPEIRNLSERFGYIYSDRHIGKEASKVISVITVWDYMVSTSYDGDYDTDFELVGAIEIGKIRSLVNIESLA